MKEQPRRQRRNLFDQDPDDVLKIGRIYQSDAYIRCANDTGLT
jgi:hypothetical protein